MNSHIMFTGIFTLITFFRNLAMQQVVGYYERNDLLEKASFNQGSQGSYCQEKSRKLCFESTRKSQEKTGNFIKNWR